MSEEKKEIPKENKKISTQSTTGPKPLPGPMEHYLSQISKKISEYDGTFTSLQSSVDDAASLTPDIDFLGWSKGVAVFNYFSEMPERGFDSEVKVMTSQSSRGEVKNIVSIIPTDAIREALEIIAAGNTIGDIDEKLYKNLRDSMSECGFDVKLDRKDVGKIINYNLSKIISLSMRDTVQQSISDRDPAQRLMSNHDPAKQSIVDKRIIGDSRDTKVGDTKDSKDGSRDSRDSKDGSRDGSRDSRDGRDSKDGRDSRDSRDIKLTSDKKDSGDRKDGKDKKDSRNSSDVNINYKLFPSPSNLCLEEAYAHILAKYPQLFMNTKMCLFSMMVPLFCPSSLQAKNSELSLDAADSIVARKIKERVNKCSLRDESFGLNLPINYDECDHMSMLRERLEQGFIGRKRRRKLKWLIRDMERKSKKVCKLKCRVEIRRTLDTSDYRDEGQDVYIKMLESALDRIKTSILIKNNGTFRNVKKHFLYPFLSSRLICDDGMLKSMDVFQHRFNTMRRLANEIMIPNGYFVSDWRNKFCRKWNGCRTSMIRELYEMKKSSKSCIDLKGKDIKDGDIRDSDVKDSKDIKEDGKKLNLFKPIVPSVVSYELASDLYPYAQKSAAHTDEAIYWFNRDANDVEVRIFFHCIANPPITSSSDVIKLLHEIPKEIRNEFNKKFTDKIGHDVRQGLMNLLNDWLRKRGKSAVLLFHECMELLWTLDDWSSI